MAKSKRQIVREITSQFKVNILDNGISVDLTSFRLQALNSRGKWTYIKNPPTMRLVRLEPVKKDLKKK